MQMIAQWVDGDEIAHHESCSPDIPKSTDTRAAHVAHVGSVIVRPGAVDFYWYVHLRDQHTALPGTDHHKVVKPVAAFVRPEFPGRNLWILLGRARGVEWYVCRWYRRWDISDADTMVHCSIRINRDGR